uniref:Synaptopodin 2-like protein n=1 Tax=Petromyzon marinus TaxID=7757 RepID=A0AAJ7WQ08_PETMA|nr:synaptopodin 2-like protein [Petromyzon marinus]
MIAAGTGMEERLLLRLSGGPPWGFRLSGGREVQSPLVVSKMRKRSAASRAGMCERDEVVAINGHPCAGLTHTQAMNLVDAGGGSLDILVGRCRNLAGAEDGHRLRASSYQELTSASDSDAYFGETDSDANTDPGWASSHRPWGHRRSPRSSPTQQQQQQQPSFTSFASSSGPASGDTGLYHEGGVEVSDLSEYDSTSELVHYHHHQQQQQQHLKRAVVNGTSGSGGHVANGSAAPPKQSSLHIVLNGGQEGEAGDGEGSGGHGGGDVAADDDAAAAAGAPAAQDGQAALAFTLNLAVRGPGGAATREVDPLRNVAIVDEEELIATYKEKAKQARLNRGESLVEKQQKEVRRRCQNIAHSLASPVPRAPSADPGSPRPDSRGILMFRRRRQRVKRYTLVSYGMASDGEGGEPPGASGEDYDEDEDEEEEEEEDEEWARTEGTEGRPNAWDAVSSDWESAGAEGHHGRGGRDSLPELGKGKGALLFERRRQRVEELSREERAAESRREKPGGAGGAGEVQNPGNDLGHAAGDQADALQGAPPHAPPSYSPVQPPQSRTFSSSVQLPPAPTRGHGVSVTTAAAPVTIAFNYSGPGGEPGHAAQPAQQQQLGEQQQQQQQYEQQQQQYQQQYEQQQYQQQQSGVQNRSARPFTPVAEGPGSQRPASAPFNRVSFSPKPPQQQHHQQQQQQHHQQQQQHHQQLQPSLSSPGAVAVNRTAQAFAVSGRGAQGAAAVAAMPAMAEEAQRTFAQPVASAAPQSSAGAGAEVLPSREQRISTPAVRTGVLQQAQRRPKQRLFSIPEPPKEKQRPNPELLSLVQGLDGRPGFESGPEDDFLSLGAEASNFLRSGSGVAMATATGTVGGGGAGGGGGAKGKTPPPPIAPKPSSGGSKPSSPVEEPQESTLFLRHTPSPCPLHTASEPGVPTLQGKGGELFARRRSRMENYVVDSPRRAPTPSSPSSLPPSWLPTSTVRTPPPPSWGKQQQYKLGGGGTGGKGKKATKPMSAKEDFAWKPHAEDAFSAYSDPHPWSPLSPRGALSSSSSAAASGLPPTGLSPWEAAARSPLGSVDAAFRATSAPAMVARAVLAAARRKTLPRPPEEWRDRVTGHPAPPASPSTGARRSAGTLPRSFGSSRAPRIFQFGPEQRTGAGAGIGAPAGGPGGAGGCGGGGRLGTGGAARRRSLSSAADGERGGMARVDLHRGSPGLVSPVDGSRDHNTRPRGWQGLSR